MLQCYPFEEYGWLLLLKSFSKFSPININVPMSSSLTQVKKDHTLPLIATSGSSAHMYGGITYLLRETAPMTTGNCPGKIVWLNQRFSLHKRRASVSLNDWICNTETQNPWVAIASQTSAREWYRHTEKSRGKR